MIPFSSPLPPIETARLVANLLRDWYDIDWNIGHPGKEITEPSEPWAVGPRSDGAFELGQSNNFWLHPQGSGFTFNQRYHSPQRLQWLRDQLVKAGCVMADD